DKLRYLSLTKPELLGDDAAFRITLQPDPKAGTLTITDNGVGMTRSELIKNLGTIASSGTQNFLGKLTGDAKKDSQLIGQFGVGFYSAFMVADKVSVVSRAAGKQSTYLWESTGDGEYTIEEVAEEHPRGTSITLHMKEDAKEYLDAHRITHVVNTYSNHIAFPITLKGEGDSSEEINSGTALWRRSKSEISDEDYTEFYRSIAFLGDDTPWLTLHHRLEGTLEYTSLLFIPSRIPFDLYHPERRRSVKLYVKRVFIADDQVDIIPQYLRFLRGVVDSDDLPLNISRETLQHNLTLQKIRRSMTKKVLSELEKKSQDDPKGYTEFWKIFGGVLKEGLCDGREPQAEILNVCRFRTLQSGEGYKSLKEYVEAMPEKQKEIYFLTADSMEAALASPQLEGFRARGLDVLLLTDGVDDFWVNVVQDFEGTPLKSITRSDTGLEDTEEEKADDKKSAKEGESTTGQEKVDALITYMKATLGDAVNDVRKTTKLKESPVCLATPEGGMDIRMERFLMENGQLAQRTAKILEINPAHPLITRLAESFAARGDQSAIADTVHLLFAQANIIEGEAIPDPGGFSRRFNALLEKTIAA
ncbi:MAG: molecular chaperone HtpG, partial [Rickettsiales bacterium]|nr:molecular chaperone HtpG [Rickettsiales bacterium]